MTTQIEQVQVMVPTPILQTIDKTLTNLIRRNIAELVDDVNRAIERGVKTDETARQADGIVQDARKAIKIVNEIRLEYTRPIDEGKKRLIAEVEAFLRPLSDSTSILDKLLLERAAEIKAKQEEARREAEQRRLEAEAEARKEEERRRNISLAKGGNGTFTPVKLEIAPQPVEQIGMRSVTRTKSIVDTNAIQSAMEQNIKSNGPCPTCGASRCSLSIPGVEFLHKIEPSVLDSAAVPDEYRRIIRG